MELNEAEYDILSKPPVSIPLLRHRWQKINCLKNFSLHRNSLRAHSSLLMLDRRRQSANNFLTQTQPIPVLSCVSQNTSPNQSFGEGLQRSIVNEYITKYKERPKKRIIINVSTQKSLPPLIPIPTKAAIRVKVWSMEINSSGQRKFSLQPKLTRRQKQKATFRNKGINTLPQRLLTNRLNNLLAHRKLAGTSRSQSAVSIARGSTLLYN